MHPARARRRERNVPRAGTLRSRGCSSPILQRTLPTYLCWTLRCVGQQRCHHAGQTPALFVQETGRSGIGLRIGQGLSALAGGRIADLGGCRAREGRRGTGLSSRGADNQPGIADKADADKQAGVADKQVGIGARSSLAGSISNRLLRVSDRSVGFTRRLSRELPKYKFNVGMSTRFLDRAPPGGYVLAGQNSVKTRAHFWLFQFYDYVYPPSPDFPNELGEPNLKPNL